MTNPPIAEIIGLFKSGKSGAGGQPEPMKRIRRDIFQLTNMLYMLRMTGAYAGAHPAKTVIVKIKYDGYEMDDPHSARPMTFVTNDPGKFTDWLGTFKAPNANRPGEPDYSAIGRHTVEISAAPRQPPLTQMHMTIVVPKDGQTKTVTTTTTTKIPIYETSPCTGQKVIVGYRDEITTSTMEVPLETEISYEGYSVTQVIPPRDFSAEAGGVTKTFTFEIYPSNESPFGDGSPFPSE
jgi:hypothetical protein